MVYKSFLKTALNKLLPVPCGLCNAPGNNHLPLCRACLDDLPFLQTACRRCALPLVNHGNNGDCGKCLQSPPACDRVQSLFLYQQPVNYLIQQFKFSRKLEYSQLFSSLLAIKLKAMTVPPDILIPVPLHSSRLRSRGFNQSWELARQLSRLSGIPASRTSCQRIKKTPLQTGLKASERKRNLARAFAVTGNVCDQHVCIIDDVMTTGSTLEAIAVALKAAGAKRVSGMVVARAVL